jgi:3-oxoacyl-[acyl-carrier protein] reductase
MKLEGKAAVVTGAGSGVGRATALALAQKGCAVLVNYSRKREAAERVAEEARAYGVAAIAMRADVSVDADCRSMMDAALRELGRLDVQAPRASSSTRI